MAGQQQYSPEQMMANAKSTRAHWEGMLQHFTQFKSEFENLVSSGGWTDQSSRGPMTEVMNQLYPLMQRGYQAGMQFASTTEKQASSAIQLGGAVHVS